MKQIQGNRHLNGSFAQIWYDGFLIAEASKITVKVTVNKEDVQTGLNVDSKIVGLKGEGTLSLTQAFTRFEKVRKAVFSGKDTRGTIIAKLKDPDASGGQTERWQVGNVSLGEFGFEWEKGAVVKKEYPFTFTPTDMINLDAIEEE